MTQNWNDHLHSRVRKISPQYKSASRRMVEFAVNISMSSYNLSHLTRSLMECLGIELTASIYRYLKAKEASMNTPYMRKMKNKKI